MALFSKDPAPASKSDIRVGSAVPAGGTFVGPNITIEGTITGSEPMTIEGTIRGRIDLASDVRIGTKARVEATVHGRNVTVEGKLTGDISADERVELVATATVDGNIKAPKIVVAEGAKFRGSVDMGSHVPKEDAHTPGAKAK
ncbi:MAG TPA: polymer-forming cytoskeletal protein [Thermoanaerobaculia bacterium]|jgi:cytoskeletal protein CcmA (bactofilin family)